MVFFGYLEMVQLSRNGEMQMFHLIPIRNGFAGKLIQRVSLLDVFWKYIFHNVEWVDAGKMRGVFWVKMYCKMSDICCFCFCLWDSTRKSEITRDVYLLISNFLAESKSNLQIKDFESYSSWPKFHFSGLG